MEPATNNPKTLFKAKWQWKSNSDPWSKTEEPQWTSYPPEHNYLLEKAYYDQQKEIDIGDHIISIRDLIQRKKGMVISQRPIRRINCEDDETDLRSERYFETELPKTINKIFGSLQHFINFFSKRNSNILSFTKQFQRFEDSNNLEGLSKTTCPQLIFCLEKELLKPIENQLQDHSVSEFKKRILRKTQKRHEELISLFKKDLGSFEEFYGLTLRSYTMNTDLYVNLNKYLRNENWIAIDELLPYAICLCKAFFSLKLSTNLQKEEELEKNESLMILYRGTALDELALSSYQKKKRSDLFSWNSVTSTSKNAEMAKNFMHLSANIENKIYPVLFIIEVPELRESKYVKWIDIHQYSAIPNEDEVVLAPGCAFELEEVSTDDEKRTTIKIKLRHEVESLAHGGLIMQGVLQSEMMCDNEKQVRIVCQEGEELSEAFKFLYGNRLIEEIEFCLCTFNNESLEEMLEFLPTLKKAKVLRFVSCKYEDEQGNRSSRFKGIKSCNISRVEIFAVQDSFKILFSQKESPEYWKSLRDLNINFLNMKTNNIKLQELGQLNQLASLTLIFNEQNAMTNKGIKKLASQGLKYLTQITSLTMDFFFCLEITDEGVERLASQGLKYLTQLSSLSISFCTCEITNTGVERLASQGLRYLTRLTSLNLNFNNCSEIKDLGMQKLTSKGLKYLTKLTSLSLDFGFCSRTTDQGVITLASEGLGRLTQLTSLTLIFANLYKITDEGMRNFACHGLKNLTQLVSLTLSFSSCSKITSLGIYYLGCQGLKYLTKLTSLSLDFSSLNITDTVVETLASKELKYLARLTSLALSFKSCIQITNRGFSSLVSQGLKYLTQLISLDLDLGGCLQITDEEMDILSHDLKYLPQLTISLLHISCLECLGPSQMNDELKVLIIYGK